MDVQSGQPQQSPDGCLHVAGECSCRAPQLWGVLQQTLETEEPHWGRDQYSAGQVGCPV